VVVIARKVSDDRESLIKKSPNQFSYEQVDWLENKNGITVLHRTSLP
jgi:hypothetical protein